MANKKYDMVVKTGTYMKGGEEKSRYLNIGAVFQGDNGFYAVLNRTFNPAGIPNPENRDSVIVSLFEPRDQQDGQRQQPKSMPPQDTEFDDEIPF